MNLIGVIKWYNDEKGFGIISTVEDGEYFIHHSNFSVKPESISFRTPVIFEPTFERNKKTAKDCHTPNDENDLFVISGLIGKPHNIYYTFINNRITQTKNYDKRRKNISVNLLNTALHYIFNIADDEKAFDLITNTYLKINENLLEFDYLSFFDIVPSIANYGKGEKFLDKIYSFFGENITEQALFQVWKNQEFNYIGKNEFDDYEISEKILENNYKEININDIKRIKSYPGGDKVCNEIISNKCQDLNINSEFSELYDYFKYITDEHLLTVINKHILSNLVSRIKRKLDLLPGIINIEGLKEYENVKELIPSLLNEDSKKQLNSLINKSIVEKSSDEIQLELWLNDYILDIDLLKIVEALADDSMYKITKVKIFSKAIQQFENIKIVELFVKHLLPENIFRLLEKYIEHENNLGNYFNLKSKLYDETFWEDKKGHDTTINFVGRIKKQYSKETLTELFFSGWLNTYPEDYVLFVADTLSKEQCVIILENANTSEDFKFKILEIKTKNYNLEELKWVLKLCANYLTDNENNTINKLVFDNINEEKYFILWKESYSKILPEKFLRKHFNELSENYSDIERWINHKIIDKTQISNIFYEIIQNIVEVKNRKEFYTIFNIIKELIKHDEDSINKLLSFKNDLYNIILWHLSMVDDFDFKTLKGKYIYFSPNDQVYIFKRLFYLKHIGKIDFTFEELDQIVRADINLFILNEEFKNDFVLDISTHTLIEAIKSYISKKNFLFESDLILKDLKNNNKRKFKIEQYFDKCPGRYIAEWNWNTSGKIYIESLVKENKEYRFFRIDFDYNEYIVENVKKIPGRKYNVEDKYWAAPLKYKDEIIKFASENNFFLDFEGSNYYNNLHLVEYKRKNDTPSGIEFCEGRKSNKEHEKLKKEFWWCVNQPCFMNAETDNLSIEPDIKKNNKNEIWKNYTLLDLLRILDINTDENKNNDIIPKGDYYKFIGHINAFNRLLDHLYCEKCGELLYPTETSHFALYRDTRFHCENHNCSEFQKTIYLNHCLNGECNNIIDSRVSKQCGNGLYICNNCGTCCSTSMFKRRLKNLEINGGYIHQGLIKNVEEEKGHLEKAEYYCYKCSGMMTEIETTLYKCEICNVEYNLKKYKWLDRKWTLKSERRKDYPIKHIN